MLFTGDGPRDRPLEQELLVTGDIPFLEEEGGGGTLQGIADGGRHVIIVAWNARG